jgi:hypothetical protein
MHEKMVKKQDCWQWKCVAVLLQEQVRKEMKQQNKEHVGQASQLTLVRWMMDQDHTGMVMRYVKLRSLQAEKMTKQAEVRKQTGMGTWIAQKIQCLPEKVDLTKAAKE